MQGQKKQKRDSLCSTIHEVIDSDNLLDKLNEKVFLSNEFLRR